MVGACEMAGSAPSPWLGVFSAPVEAWVLLVVGALLCASLIRRDWRQIRPGRARRSILSLTVLMCVCVFGVAFLGIALAHGLTLIDTAWYEPNFERLKASHCSTAALDAAFVQQNRDAIRLMGVVMAFAGLGIVIRPIRGRMRRRHM